MMRLASALSIAMMAASVAVAWAPAEAALSDCTNSRTCIWADVDFENDRASIGQGIGTFTYVGDTLNNRMDSWANKSITYTSCGADYANGGGDKQVWPPGNQDPEVAPWNGDEVSSFRSQGGCP